MRHRGAEEGADRRAGSPPLLALALPWPPPRLDRDPLPAGLSRGHPSQADVPSNSGNRGPPTQCWEGIASLPLCIPAAGGCRGPGPVGRAGRRAAPQLAPSELAPSELAAGFPGRPGHGLTRASRQGQVPGEGPTGRPPGEKAVNAHVVGAGISTAFHGRQRKGVFTAQPPPALPPQSAFCPGYFGEGGLMTAAAAPPGDVGASPSWGFLPSS